MINLFSIISSNPACQAVLGTNPCRFFPFGYSVQGMDKPYILWQNISGSPENNLSQSPDIDFNVIQVDIYGSSTQEVNSAFIAVRDALEAEGYITSFGVNEVDTETKLYRLGFDFEVWSNR